MRRVARLMAALLGASVLAFPATPERVAAAPSDVVAVVIEGTGNGHGRGLSQWGAYGWAVDQGKDWRWILDHYYGGTTLGDVSTAQSRIRVRLTALDGLARVGVIASSGRVNAVVGGEPKVARSMYATEVAPNQFRVYGSSSVTCPGSLVVPDGPISKGSTNSTGVRQIQTFLNAYRVGGDITLTVDGDFGNLTETRLRDWQGDQGLPATGIWDGDDAARARVLIAASSGSAGWVEFTTTPVSGPVVFGHPDGDDPATSASAVLGACDASGRVTHYRGQVEFRSDGDGNHVVNDVRTEDYVRGVVPKEISASWADAGGGAGANAVRAQAVAARSFGLQQARYPYASTCDTQSCQVYGGTATRSTATGTATLVEDLRTDQAIVATAGKVRKWPNGTVVSTEFSASNGPRTAGGVFPPVDDALGDATPRNPNHRWTRVLDADTLAATYGLGSITSASMVDAASSVYRQFDGIWFNDIVLTGSNGTTFRQQAWDFRNQYGLPSPGFTVRVVTRDTVGASMAFIGDSIGSGIAGTSTSVFRTLTDGTFASSRFDSVVSRCTTTTSCPGTSGVEAARSLPVNLDLVVVELGYNDWPPGFADDIDAMMAALTARGARQVLWVNLAEIRTGTGGTSYYRQSNAALNAARSRWPNLAVADWNRASSVPEQPRWFTSDGVHLTTTGQAKFSLWLRNQVLAVPLTHRLAAKQRIELPVVGTTVTGADGIVRTIPAGVSAVSLNVTAVDPGAAGFMTVWPCDVSRPESSNLNYVAGSVVANGVIAPVGASGKVCIYSNAASDLVVDVAGWFAGGPVGSAAFVGTTPKRFVDTRTGVGAPRARVQPSSPLSITIDGAAVTRTDGTPTVIPANASAVAVNVTAVNPSATGYLTVWPCGSTRPVASNVNYVAGSVVANGVVAPIGADGSICLYTNQPTDVVVDVLGWFNAGVAEPPFVGAVPRRLVDTRSGVGGPAGRVTPATPKVVAVSGVELDVGGATRAIPADAAAVALNVTIVDARASGFATVWPCGSTRPEASNVNFVRGRTVANNVIATLGNGGTVCIHTNTDAHLVVDVQGWFTGGTPPSFTGNVPRRLVDTRVALGPAPV